MEEKKIIKADKNYRKLVIIFIIFLVIFGIFFINYFQKFLKDLETLADNSPELAIEKILSVLKIVTISITVFFALLGLYYIRLAILILRTNEFPPLGIRVIKDTPFVTGKNAQRKGIAMLIFAIALIAVGLVFPIYMNKIFQTLLL